jgi:hypothetical protein
MSSQTFKAQMAVGSWAKIPLFSGLSDVTKIVEKCMSRMDDGETDCGSDEEDELDVEMLTSEP